TGGAAVTAFGTIRANSQVRSSGTFGVLRLTLSDGSYHWQFVPVAGKTFSDSGSTSCHGMAPTVNAGPDLKTNPGDTVTLRATFTDPDAADAPWAYTVGWGDAARATGPRRPRRRRSPPRPGTGRAGSTRWEWRS